jgi:endonuclease YncB( thermonuclease family)
MLFMRKATFRVAAIVLSFRLLFVALIALVAIQAPADAGPITSQEIKARDGDTIYARKHRWRMLEYDTPEIWSRWRKVSPEERALGKLAKKRFKELLQSGKLDLTERRCSCPERDIGTTKCNHGRKCGLLTRDGENIGDQLIREGLAEPYVCETDKCPPMPIWDDLIREHQQLQPR